MKHSVAYEADVIGIVVPGASIQGGTTGAGLVIRGGMADPNAGVMQDGIIVQDRPGGGCIVASLQIAPLNNTRPLYLPVHEFFAGTQSGAIGANEFPAGKSRSRIKR